MTAASIDGDKSQRLAEAARRVVEQIGGHLDLDTKAIDVHSLGNQDNADIAYQFGAADPILGRRLRLELPDGTTSITIHYTISPDAIALQWFEPGMTLGKRHPFMYSQCQAIHARSIIPCQDTPRVRVSYSAAVTVPEKLSVVMSAGPAGDVQDKDGDYQEVGEAYDQAQDHRYIKSHDGIVKAPPDT